MKKLIMFIIMLFAFASFSYAITFDFNPSHTAGGANDGLFGFNVTINNSIDLMHTDMKAGSSLHNVEIYDSNGVFMAQSDSGLADIYTFTPSVTLSGGDTEYWIVANLSGGLPAYWRDTTYSYPVSNNDLKVWNRRYYSGGTWFSATDRLAMFEELEYSLTVLKVGVTLDYPTNQTRYNENYNGSIVLSTNVSSTCVLNESAWTLTSASGTEHNFYNGAPTEQNYLIEYSCYTNPLNATNGTINFTVDLTEPVINFVSPQNTTRFLNNSGINMTIDFTDENAIWQFNITIRNASDNIVYSNFTTNISISSDVKVYNFTHFIALDIGNHTISVTLWDSHTDYDLDSYYESNYKQNEFETIDQSINDENIKMLSAYPITTIRKSDRISYNVGQNTEYIIQSEKPFAYLPNSELYDCHLITGNIWHDCNGLKNPKVQILDKNSIKISFDKVLNQISESSGVLNNITQEIWFFAGDRPPDTNITNPLNGTVFGNQNVNFTWVSYDRHDTLNYTGYVNNISVFNTVNLWGNYSHTVNGSYEFILQTCETTGLMICINDSVNYEIDIALIIHTIDSEISHNANLYFIFGLWVVLVVFAFWIRKFQLLILTAIYGIFSTIWLFKYLPLDSGWIVATYGIINVWLLYHSIFSKGDDITG